MSNYNIQIGIDLGTTNSEIAIFNRGAVEIIKNVFGDEYTPSVFGIDKSKNRVVGKKSYERLYKDFSEDEFKNNKAEVKRLMGTSKKVHFDRINKDLNPEEISAEILKILKEDILRKYPDFATQSAVITTPASFSVLQAEATKRAGNIAGFEYVVLLQEPIAAAIAYGFANATNENWLVYDLGGGTFDVALVSFKEGVLSVLNNNGNNFLGGKDFDRLIVEKIIVPKIMGEYQLKEFCEGNRKYCSVFAKLKYIAESSKIYISQYDKTNMEIEGVGEDDSGKEIYLSVELLRKDFETLIKPLVDETIDLAKKTIKESGVKQSSIKKVVLVGGPTMIPYIRNRIERELKISVDSSVDPLSVVARGACIFATSQKIPQDILQKGKKIDKKIKNMDLFYDSLTADTEETISGVIEDLKKVESGYFIQIQSESGHYVGSKIELKNGKFFETVTLEPQKTNLFWIYLFDKKGNAIPLTPDSFSITHGLSVSGAPIPHSIGVAVAKKELETRFKAVEVFHRYFEKNSILPLSKPDNFKTLKALKKGDKENALPIKVYEGESEIPDRNKLITELNITGEKLRHDLPEGTEVEITISVNESREVTVEAYIGAVDLRLTKNVRLDKYEKDPNVDNLESELNAQRERLKTIEDNCTQQEKDKLGSKMESISRSLGTARSDEDSKMKAQSQLKDLKMHLDNLEQAKEMPQLTKEFRETINDLKQMIEDIGDERNKEENIEQLNILNEQGASAIKNNDKYTLIRTNEQIKELSVKVWFSHPAAWAHQFKMLTSGEHSFVNKTEADYYIRKGQKAIEMGDVDELKRCVQNLIALLPPEKQEEISSNISGITY